MDLVVSRLAAIDSLRNALRSASPTSDPNLHTERLHFLLPSVLEPLLTPDCYANAETLDIGVLRVFFVTRR